jgi:DNA-binding transcriptional MerR regulator
MSFALVRTPHVTTWTRPGTDRPKGLDLEAFARVAGVHPELVRRFIRLGLLEPARRPDGGVYFGRQQFVDLGRIERLHAHADLNYAAIGLVLDLLDRIAQLEAALRRTSQPTGARSWTRIV